MDWTQEDDKTLRQGLEDGLSTRLISENVGKSRNAVIGRIHRLGITPKPPIITKSTHRKRKRKPGRPLSGNDRINPETIVDNIIDYKEMGLTWEEIGVIYNTSTATVRHWAIRYGGYEPPKMRMFSLEDEAYIVEAWRDHVLVEDIADKLGRSFGVIRQKILSLQERKVISHRDPSKTRLLRQYGEQALAAGATASEALHNISQAKLDAKKAALQAAHDAKRAFIIAAIRDMHDAIERGVDRNLAIFHARAKGAHLEDLAIEFNLTRERIRQICNKTAEEIALKKLVNGE